MSCARSSPTWWATPSTRCGEACLHIRIHRALSSGTEGIRVVVADTGTGIPQSVRPLLFEPFVSTKGNTGTGLGLWVAGEIVRRHSGSIRLKSRERVGTVFSVFLPLRGAAAESVSKTA